MKVPVLLYHDINPQPITRFERYTVTTHQFARQMRLLKLLGYSTITPDALEAHLLRGAPLPSRPILITFDDGLESCVHQSLPILREHGFTAVYFLVTGLMGDRAQWLEDDPPGSMRIITWDTARQLERDGFVCGAHSLTHANLAHIPADVCLHEVSASRRILEEQLGRQASLMAYPFGSFNQCVRQMICDAGYTMAFTSHRGFVTARHDRLTLPRISIDATHTMLDFASRLLTSFPANKSVPRKLLHRRNRRTSTKSGVGLICPRL